MFKGETREPLMWTGVGPAAGPDLGQPGVLSGMWSWHGPRLQEDRQDTLGFSGSRVARQPGGTVLKHTLATRFWGAGENTRSPSCRVPGCRRLSQDLGVVIVGGSRA